MTPFITLEKLQDYVALCYSCHQYCQHKVRFLCPVEEVEEKQVPVLLHHATTFGRIILAECAMCHALSYDLYRNEQSILQDGNTYALYKIYPPIANPKIPQPNSYLPEEIASLYKEAALIFDHSPRSSATLLRLALQHLLEYLGFNKGKNNNLNDMIGQAVKDGVPEYVQKIMDVTRHIGNQSAHHLTFNPDDTADDATSLFSNINDIALYFIETKERANKSYAGLPENVRKSIEKRDKKQPPPQKHPS